MAVRGAAPSPPLRRAGADAQDLLAYGVGLGAHN